MANDYLGQAGLTALIAKIKTAISTAVSGLYTKPSTGIPKGDLASDVQTSLGKADSTALLIPGAASATNKLADKAYADAIGERLEARYISADASGNPFATHAALTGATTYYYHGSTATPDTNDITTVIADEDHRNSAGAACPTRYRFNGNDAQGKATWAFEYVINNTALSAEQLEAINSGMTSDDKAKLDGIASGAEVNVQSDWNTTNTSADSYIKNKPSTFTPSAHSHSRNDIDGVTSVVNIPSSSDNSAVTVNDLNLYQMTAGNILLLTYSGGYSYNQGMDIDIRHGGSNSSIHVSWQVAQASGGDISVERIRYLLTRDDHDNSNYAVKYKTDGVTVFIYIYWIGDLSSEKNNYYIRFNAITTKTVYAEYVGSDDSGFTSATNAIKTDVVADKVKSSLTVFGKTYDGSSEISVSESDIGTVDVAKSIHYSDNGMAFYTHFDYNKVLTFKMPSGDTHCANIFIQSTSSSWPIVYTISYRWKGTDWTNVPHVAILYSTSLKSDAQKPDVRYDSSGYLYITIGGTNTHDRKFFVSVCSSRTSLYSYNTTVGTSDSSFTGATKATNIEATVLTENIGTAVGSSNKPVYIDDVGFVTAGSAIIPYSGVDSATSNDFNSYTTEGVYSHGGGKTSWSNAPSDLPGSSYISWTLVVFVNRGRVEQHLYGYVTDGVIKEWARASKSGGTTWSSWETVAFESSSVDRVDGFHISVNSQSSGTLYFY